MRTVTIYSTPTCHFCNLAKDFFAKHRILFTDHNVATDLVRRQEMLQKTGQMGVPVITVSDASGEEHVIIGFDQGALERALGVL